MRYQLAREFIVSALAKHFPQYESLPIERQAQEKLEEQCDKDHTGSKETEARLRSTETEQKREGEKVPAERLE